MRYDIIACGDSAKDWHLKATGISIGLNDMMKFGHQPHILGIFNHRNRFTQERINVITKTKPNKFYSDSESWLKYFPNMTPVKLRSWDGILRKEIDRLAHAHTSPFIGMSLAYNLGATKIVLWGADFKTHQQWTAQNPQMKLELRAYRQLTEALRREGVKVYLGAPGSLLEEFLTVCSE